MLPTRWFGPIVAFGMFDTIGAQVIPRAWAPSSRAFAGKPKTSRHALTLHGVLAHKKNHLSTPTMQLCRWPHHAIFCARSGVTCVVVCLAAATACSGLPASQHKAIALRACPMHDHVKSLAGLRRHAWGRSVRQLLLWHHWPSAPTASRQTVSRARSTNFALLQQPCASPRSAPTPNSSGRLAVGSSSSPSRSEAAGAPKRHASCACSLDVGLGRFRQHAGPRPPAPSPAVVRAAHHFRSPGLRGAFAATLLALRVASTDNVDGPAPTSARSWQRPATPRPRLSRAACRLEPGG